MIFLRRLVPGSADKSCGLHVARLAGLPEQVVAQAEEVMARLEHDARKGDIEPHRAFKIVREVATGLLLAGDDEAAWAILRDLYRLDIANMTPVQALVTLNEWQTSLRARK